MAPKLKLSDVGMNCQLVLQALAEMPMRRRGLANKTGLTVIQVSRSLNRLELFALVDHPETHGGDWIITPIGMAILGKNETMPSDVIQDVAIADNQKVADETNANAEEDFDYSARVIAMEVEASLDYIRTKLQAPAIPASAQRVYRELLAVLPTPLIEALAPITALITSHH